LPALRHLTGINCGAHVPTHHHQSAISKVSSSPSSPSSSIVKYHLPIVYPALLSQVAEKFRTQITLSNRMMDNLEYKGC